MKYLLSGLLVCFFFTKTFSQADSLVAKFNGDCLISGGSITLADYKKLHSLCPPKLTKVIRYKFTYQAKGTHKKNAHPAYFEANMDFQLLSNKVKSGDIIMMDEIIGLGLDKKKAIADPIILFIK